MKYLFFILAAFYCIQVSTSATPEDAEHKLKELRELTHKRVHEAFFEHSKMSTEVDDVADKTKLYGQEEIAKKTEKYLAKLKSDRALTHRCRGTRDHIFQHLQQLHTEELIKCVDQHGSQSVRVLSTQRMSLVKYVWSSVYHDEKQIIVCGRNSNCLDAAIANINDQIDEVTKVIQDEVDISKHNTEVQIQYIKQCASRSIANAEHALSKVPTCVY